jgi:hypothetical protein
LDVSYVALRQFAFQRIDGGRVLTNEPVVLEEEIALGVIVVTLDGIVHKHCEKLIVDEPAVVIPKQMPSPLFHRPFAPFHIVQVADPPRKQPRVGIDKNLLRQIVLAGGCDEDIILYEEEKISGILEDLRDGRLVVYRRKFHCL